VSRRPAARSSSAAPSRRCAVYTRVSTDHGLEQDFNSLDAQREACSAYVCSQALEGWIPAHGRYDDGGYSGASLDRPSAAADGGSKAHGPLNSVTPTGDGGKRQSPSR
jgi:site-specific DNA recombinase